MQKGVAATASAAVWGHLEAGSVEIPRVSWLEASIQKVSSGAQLDDSLISHLALADQDS